MKVAKSWLKDFIKYDLTDKQLADLLSTTGTEVESVSSGIDPGVIAVKIVSIKKHPNADKLQIATVTDGKNELEIVCGAPNIKVGLVVPLAQISVILPEFQIKKATIRGIESSGMLCSEKELGLGDDQKGIKILDKKFELGRPIAEVFGGETVFELEITPNRGDCLSHLGVAREVAAITNSQIKKEPIQFKKESGKTDENISVEILSKDCPQYLARVIKNVKIGPSPVWLQKRLLSIGFKPINNVVDVTNYIMMDLGHPLHAFDADKIRGKKIIVRRAKKYEKIITLDNESRTLSQDSLVIADAKNAIAIAGVMGGLESQVTNKTTDIVLEAAEFDRKSIRKTIKSLGINTDASYRFERGIDSSGIEYAINKAASLIAEVSGGVIAKGIVRAGERAESEFIEIEYQNINDSLGLSLKKEDIDHSLRVLGFEIKNNVAKIPSWRNDIEIQEDLVEEVGRLYHYDRLPLFPLPKEGKAKHSSYYFKEFIKDILVNAGFVEVYNYSFLSEKDIEALKIDSKDLLEVANPVQPENKYLRKSLLPGLLRNIAKNPTFDPTLLFEIGNVFTKTEEKTNLALVVSGKLARKLINDAVLQFSKKLEVSEKTFSVNELTRDDTVRFKIRKPLTYSVEIPVEELIKKTRPKADQPLADKINLSLSLSKKQVHYRPVSKYPSVVRDLAFLVDKKVETQNVIDSIYKISDLINRVELFDEFASDKLGKNKKNIAFHIDLQDLDKTLTDKEADSIISKTVKAIESNFPAKLRNY